MKRTLTFTTFGLLGALSTSQGAFTLLEDFEGYTTGAISGQSSNWSHDTSAGQADGTVGSSAGNQYLIQGGANNNHTKFDNTTILIADGAIGTYFFRAFMTGDSHVGAAMSPLTAATAGNAWGDAKPIVRIGNRVGSGANTQLYAYNDNTYTPLASDTVSGAWYNIWVLVDNTDGNRDYDVHIQSDDDGNYATQTQVGPSGLGFRGDVAEGDLQSLFFRTAINSNEVYFDDLYIDSTTHNLVNPVPEPTTALLGSLSLLTLLRRKR
ncbi:hypothetical protein [Roseibacillus persicicus]|uniref:hypothetical protein n=1 Tax=Roseibacillus persicicus TaxID=454148 RepID=UPI00280CFBEA|nr:hypothetical protein [Roseibacillus persicicus]MDQ8191321.1 hypothetical protein [Roseibacillus persicicus]